MRQAVKQADKRENFLAFDYRTPALSGRCVVAYHQVGGLLKERAREHEQERERNDYLQRIYNPRARYI
jgi:hypothetical protein